MRAGFVVLPFGALLLAFATPASADIRYLYDELGRLVRVIREDGEAASYHYDAVGNILRITRESGVAQTTSVTSQSATSGSRQTSVTMTLTGSNLIGAGVFSSVAGISFQNVLTDFDGMTLTIMIAADAPLGPGQIEVRGGLGTITLPFAVLGAAPSIASFDPTLGVAGIVVTIQGSGFVSGTPANNQVTFNGTAASVQSATETTLSVLVPAGATSGPISVTTPGGTAVSATAFVTGTVAVTNVTPGQGVRGQTVAVTIAGTNLLGSTVQGFDVSASNVTATATQLTLDLGIGLSARSSTFSVTNQVTTTPVPFTALPSLQHHRAAAVHDRRPGPDHDLRIRQRQQSAPEHHRPVGSHHPTRVRRRRESDPADRPGGQPADLSLRAHVQPFHQHYRPLEPGHRVRI